MKVFLVSNFGQRTQALAALSLATAALILLLGIWIWLLPVEAREPAAVGLGDVDLILSSSDTITKSMFLPIISKSDLVFSDDFSDTSSGWPHQVTFDENCYVEYRDGRYRVKVTQKDQRCLIYNSRIPKLVNGMFSVRVRRKSDENRHLLYGLIFGAGRNASKNRWALEVYPNNDELCDNRKPFFQLTAIVDGKRKYFTQKCTDAIDIDRDDWNELKVIRDGQNIYIYINGRLKGNYFDAKYLLDEGYSLLEVVSLSDETIRVEFDDFTIRQITSSP